MEDALGLVGYRRAACAPGVLAASLAALPPSFHANKSQIPLFFFFPGVFSLAIQDLRPHGCRMATTAPGITPV